MSSIVKKISKYVRLRERSYIHTCRFCVHVTQWSHQLEHLLSSMRWPIRPILGWGSKVPKMRFPALDTDEPPCKI